MAETNPAPNENRRAASKQVRKKAEIPFHKRATCTIAQACAGTGLGRTLIYELIGEKLVESSTIKRRRLVNVPSLLKAVGYKPPAESSEAH